MGPDRLVSLLNALPKTWELAPRADGSPNLRAVPQALGVAVKLGDLSPQEGAAIVGTLTMLRTLAEAVADGRARVTDDTRFGGAGVAVELPGTSDAEASWFTQSMEAALGRPHRLYRWDGGAVVVESVQAGDVNHVLAAQSITEELLAIAGGGAGYQIGRCDAPHPTRGGERCGRFFVQTRGRGQRASSCSGACRKRKHDSNAKARIA